MHTVSNVIFQVMSYMDGDFNNSRKWKYRFGVMLQSLELNLVLVEYSPRPRLNGARRNLLVWKIEGVERFFVTCEFGLFVNGHWAITCYFPRSSVMRFSSDIVILSFLNSRNVIRLFQNLVRQRDKNFRRPS